MIPLVSDATALRALHILSLTTSMLALAACVTFVRFYFRTPNRRRYAGMLVWLVTLTAWFVVNAVLRLFFNYRTPTVFLTLSRVIFDSGGFIIIILTFAFLDRWRRRL